MQPSPVSSLAAYQAIADTFSSDIRFQIEILPPAITPPGGELLMIDNECIGIPKKVLVEAFLVARAQFMNGLRNADILDRSLSDATRVILLFDPEHLTAANFRKRRLKHVILAGRKHEMYEETTRELHFLNSILTSPLHRQSKSPTLWFHRYWLVRQLFTESKNPQSIVQNEIWAVLRSAERHANNYYAWQHGRRMVSLFVEKVGNTGQEWLLPKFLAWCLAHPSDISGWTFLLFLLTTLLMPQAKLSATMKSIMDFVEDTGWKKEALWVFLTNVSKEPSLLSDDWASRLLSMLNDQVQV